MFIQSAGYLVLSVLRATAHAPEDFVARGAERLLNSNVPPYPDLTSRRRLIEGRCPCMAGLLPEDHHQEQQGEGYRHGDRGSPRARGASVGGLLRDLECVGPWHPVVPGAEGDLAPLCRAPLEYQACSRFSSSMAMAIIPS